MSRKHTNNKSNEMLKAKKALKMVPMSRKHTNNKSNELLKAKKAIKADK